ncbi:MAG TPA: GFA family protein [Xanthomonadaceae bacterium]|nr:GFA family protein [Xanthomonadaceae bacterium]
MDSGAKQGGRFHGSCHCGRIAFDVEGTIGQVVDCNCSLCRRRGGLLWFVPRGALRLVSPENSLWTYTFNSHVLQHHFCANCGIAPFSEGEKKGEKMAAINVRCLDDVDLSKLNVVEYDGRSL